jgi:hypothetical protein
MSSAAGVLSDAARAVTAALASTQAVERQVLELRTRWALRSRPGSAASALTIDYSYRRGSGVCPLAGPR